MKFRAGDIISRTTKPTIGHWSGLIIFVDENKKKYYSITMTGYNHAIGKVDSFSELREYFLVEKRSWTS